MEGMELSCFAYTYFLLLFSCGDDAKAPGRLSLLFVFYKHHCVSCSCASG